MRKISSINDVKRSLKDVGSVVGLGVNAFPRAGIANLVNDYQILCIQESSDLEFIRKKIKTISLKGDIKGRVNKLNTLSLLRHGEVQKYIESLGRNVNLFVYRSSERIEAIADKLGVRILSNRSKIRDVYEDKWEFRGLAEKAGLRIIPGEQMMIDQFGAELFEDMQKKYGPKLVFQITDYKKGGGIGTFFINHLKDFEKFHGYVKRRRKDGRNLQRVNVTKFIEGESASINGCITRYGVLTSLVQRQIVDVRGVVGYYGRSGVFCGHDWGERYSEEINKKARKLVKDLGELMRDGGYRGIFGIDLVVNRSTNEVSMVECNPRYTGAFPVYSMMQAENGEIPMDAWHLLEQAGVDYEMDFDEVQKSYYQVKWGAQLILHNLERAWVKVGGEVKPGVYQLRRVKSKGHIVNEEWVRDGFTYQDLKSEDELVLTDGVSKQGMKLKPGARMGRVIFKREVMKNEENELQEEVRRAMIDLYQRFKLEKVKKKK